MKNIYKKFLFYVIITFIMVISSSIYAYNYETTEMRLYSMRDGFKTCVKSPVLGDNRYLYFWGSFDNNSALQAWPGVPLVKEQNNEDIYCYTYHKTDNIRYNYVIFNDNSKQTIDLNTITDSKGIINSLLYRFDESGINSNGKYVGAWHIYDTSKLIELVAEANGLNSKDYTISSYSAVQDALGDKVEVNEITEANKDNYNLGAYYISKLNDSNDVLNKLVVNYSNENNKYTALYVDKYNELATALNSLQKRKDIVIDSNVSNGSVSAEYAANSDTSVNITANPNKGYKISSLRVSKILSYDSNNQPVLGESYDIDIDNQPYNYSFSSNDTMVGVYISATFKKNTYKLTFKVGENGKILTTDDSQVLSPVTVEYNDDYSIKVIANEGYKVNKVLVDGKKYSLTNGVLIIENVSKDAEIEVSFIIETYIIKIDGKEYTFAYGTSYEDMLKSINTDKDGYVFKKLLDKNGNVLDKNYTVKNNDELTAEYEKIKNESKNPNTFDSILNSFILLILILPIIILIYYIILKKNKKKRI